MSRLGNTALAMGLALFIGGAVAGGIEDPPEEHVKWMDQLRLQSGAIRKGIDVEKNAAAMQATLEQVGAWWKPRNSEVAEKAWNDSHRGAQVVAKAAAAADQQGVATGVKMIGAGCMGCHDVHREKVGPDEYKIK